MVKTKNLKDTVYAVFALHFLNVPEFYARNGDTTFTFYDIERISKVQKSLPSYSLEKELEKATSEDEITAFLAKNGLPFVNDTLVGPTAFSIAQTIKKPEDIGRNPQERTKKLDKIRELESTRDLYNSIKGLKESWKKILKSKKLIKDLGEGRVTLDFYDRSYREYIWKALDAREKRLKLIRCLPTIDNYYMMAEHHNSSLLFINYLNL